MIHNRMDPNDFNMKPSWEANHCAASQEIPRILWNPKGSLPHSPCPKLVSILSQLNPVHTPTSHYLKIRLNIILQSRPGSPQWSLSLRFSQQNPVHPPMCYMWRPFNFLRFHHLHNSGWGVHIKLFIMKVSPFPCYLIPLRPKCIHQTPSAYFPLSMSVTSFHTHTQQAKL
jgi:hypothetical protein